MANSPTTRSLEHLRAEGWLCEKVEYWQAHARVTKDLFGFIDILCVKDEHTMGVQTTSASNVSSRINKIIASPNLAPLRKAGWRLEIHGWRKTAKTGKWNVRVVDVS